MSVRVRVTVGQIEGYSPCDALIWPTSGPTWPTFFVTDVTDVTRHTDCGQKSGHPQKSDPDFSLELQRKVGVAIFCEKYILID